MKNVIDQLKTIENSHKTEQFFKKYEKLLTPFYHSVDIRDAGFKNSVVDMNLFPAGFNNISETFNDDLEQQLFNSIKLRNSNTNRILLFIESHTRNMFYLKNIYVLYQFLNKHFEVHVAAEMAPENKTQFIDQPDFKYDIFNILHLDVEQYDFVLLNNDLTLGIPDYLLNTKVKIFPSMELGWHNRTKSSYFDIANKLIEELCDDVGIDPWLLSCFHSVSNVSDINNEDNQKQLADLASDLIKRIKDKYDEYGIDKQPSLFLKSDYGTYGMGVISINDPKDILSLNRKSRNKMLKGKQSKKIDRILIQEGVPTQYIVNDAVAEVCLYSINNQHIGSFFRLNSQKTMTDNLNSQGMHFLTIPKNVHKSDCDSCDDLYKGFCEKFKIYNLLSKIASLAAAQEDVNLQSLNVSEQVLSKV